MSWRYCGSHGLWDEDREQLVRTAKRRQSGQTLGTAPAALCFVQGPRRRPWVTCVSQFSCSIMSNSLQPHGLQHARPPCPSQTPGVYLNSMSVESVMPSNHLILCCPVLPPPKLSQQQGLFQWVSSLHQVARVPEFQLQR